MRTHLLCAIGLGTAFLAACGGGDGGAGPAAGGSNGAPPIALAVSGPADLAADTVTLVSTVRVGRTEFDYTYSVRVTNGGAAALPNVTATVTSAVATTLVTDGALAFGDIGSGASVTSSDTFTIRQDRSAPLAATDLGITLASTPVEGVLLGGQPGDNALAALTDLTPIPARDEDVVGGVILTRLDVGITAVATVGEVNDALQAIGARIAGMHAGLPVLVLAVPRQVDAQAMEAMATGLASRASVRLAFPGREAVADLAPPSPANAELALRHLNDARFPAAWNVNRLAGSCTAKPVVLVADFFTRPIPGNSEYADFGLEVPGVDAQGIGGGGTFPNAGFHGYDVLTTLAAALDDAVPTGASPFPGCLDLRTVEVKGLSQGGIDIEIAISAALPGQSKVVVNTSLGAFECTNPCLPQNLAARDAGDLAFHAATLRAILAPVADRVLWATAAGNGANDDVALVYPGAGLAQFASVFSIAERADPDMSFALDESLWEPPGEVCGIPPTPTCFRSLTITPAQLAALEAHLADLGPAGRTPAANVMIVGSTVPTTNLLSAFSNPGADIATVGEGIPTMRQSANLDFVTTQGTSFASPQVAALAAYLWTVSPELRDVRSVASTRSAIEANAAGLAAQIDAYASVLSLDPVGDPDPTTWRIRRTLLDADDSGSFTETDVTAFVARYFEPPELVNPVSPAVRDYSRFDLNGDGFTGGNTAAVSFDLDRSGSTQFGAPQLAQFDLQIGGERIDFDERFVSDLEVLCYYAYSALYQGSEEERERLLAGRCVPLSVHVTPANPTVGPGATASFAAEVRGSTDPRVTWSLPDGGGTIDANGLFTAGSGFGSFRVRAASVADPEVTGEALATVRAAGTLDGLLTMEQHGLAQPPGSNPNADINRSWSGNVTAQVVGQTVTIPAASGPVSFVTVNTNVGCAETNSFTGDVTGGHVLAGTTLGFRQLQLDATGTFQRSGTVFGGVDPHGDVICRASGPPPTSTSTFLILLFQFVMSEDGTHIVGMDFNVTIGDPPTVQTGVLD